PAGRVVVVLDNQVAGAVAEEFQPPGGVVEVVGREAVLIDHARAAFVLVGVLQEPAVGVGDLGDAVGVLWIEVLQLGGAGPIDGLDDVAAGVVVVLDEGPVGQLAPLQPAIGVYLIVDQLAAAVRPAVELAAGVHRDALDAAVGVGGRGQVAAAVVAV